MSGIDNLKRVNWRQDVLPIVIERLSIFDAQGIIPTLRTMFYSLVSLNIIPNSQNYYQSLSKNTANWREQGNLPINCFADQSRYIIEDFDDDYISYTQYADGLISLLEKAPFEYQDRISKWHNQPEYVEVWIEKDAQTGTFRSVLKNMHVRIVPTRGFTSVSFHFDNIKRLKKYQDKGKRIHIRYFGDLDPSGESIEEIINKKLYLYGIFDVDFKRVAITEEQMERYSLPRNPDPETLKKLKRDPRAKSFIAKHNDLYQIEVDAFQAYAPEDFKKLILESVNEFYDERIYEEFIARHSPSEISKFIKTSVSSLLDRLE